MKEVEPEPLLEALVRSGGVKFLEAIAGPEPARFPIQPEALDSRLNDRRLRLSGYDLSFWMLKLDGESISEADVQLRRPSAFPAPFLNRNRPLLNRLIAWADSNLGSRSKHKVVASRGRHYHYGATRNLPGIVVPERWDSELAIIDEHYSSGQVLETQTSNRNDFIILRFRRPPAV